MNWRFVLRGLIFATVILTLGAVAVYLYLSRFSIDIPTGPTPAPPTIIAPEGPLPEYQVGLKEWAKYEGKEYIPVGNGFFLQLDDGTIIGVTTAHSISTFASDHSLVKIAFSMGREPSFLAEMDTLHGEPGKPRYGRDMTVDYVLLRLSDPVDPSLSIVPDARGEPQAGESVFLYSGLGDVDGIWSAYPGVIQAVDENGAWAVMDENFQPAGMSGSPFVSAHTGKVVGMAIMAATREGRLYIGMHPIGALVEKAEAAVSYPLIQGFTH